jgi:hypothetical protein
VREAWGSGGQMIGVEAVRVKRADGLDRPAAIL